jgi:Uma2 family endonuclease
MPTIITDINQLDLSKSYTYADYLTWQFDEMVEIIKGKIFKMSPAPNTKHQDISVNLTRELSVFLKKKPCKLFAAPFDVRFVKNIEDKTITTVTQPDLCVICDPAKIDERGCVGAPDFIIEILSPATKSKDIHEKFDLYQEFGVSEYWIVDPLSQIVDVFLLKDGHYQLKGKYTNDDKIEVNTLAGLVIELNDIFG